MKLRHIAACLAGAFALHAHAQPDGEKSAQARFVDTAGKEIGTATLRQTPGGVLISVHISELPPGEHGFHIHERGACDPKSGFKSAGEHFAPSEKPHGYFGKPGHHAGDMPNQHASQDGKLRAEVLNSEVRLTPTSLLDEDGSALVVHAQPDDYKSQPSGDAGDRIACAVIEPAGTT